MNPFPLLIALAIMLIFYVIMIPIVLLISSHLVMRQRQRNALHAFTCYRNSSKP